VPAVAAVTLTLTVQVPGVPEGMLRLLRLTDAAPAVAPTVPVQVVVALGVAATTRFPGVVGNVSENATPVRATVFTVGFVRVKVMVEVPFTGMVLGEKALLIEGGATTSNALLVPLIPVACPGLPVAESVTELSPVVIVRPAVPTPLLNVTLTGEPTSVPADTVIVAWSPSPL
jgi:hypothetical protein